MIKKSYLKQMRAQFHAYAAKRQAVIKQSSDALHYAKRAIFSLQRDDLKEAQAKLSEAEKILRKLEKQGQGDAKFGQEGSYRAAIEEYVEAALLYQFLTDGKIGPVTSVPVDSESYIAGLCDVPGELYRYAIKAATVRNHKTVERCAALSNEIIGELIEFDLTSYLRTKFDQAKQANHRLEQVVYEVSVRHS